MRQSLADDCIYFKCLLIDALIIFSFGLSQIVYLTMVLTIDYDTDYRFFNRRSSTACKCYIHQTKAVVRSQQISHLTLYHLLHPSSVSTCLLTYRLKTTFYLLSKAHISSRPTYKHQRFPTCLNFQGSKFKSHIATYKSNRTSPSSKIRIHDLVD